MHFCSCCGNMYYMRLKEDPSDDDTKIDSLEYYCRKCGNVSDMITSNPDNLIVSTINIKNKTQKFHHIINKYTKLDPTLPRLYDTIDCPNSSCSSNKEDDTKSENEIIYMRYDDSNMKYVYMCSNCDSIWTNSKVF